MGRVGKPCSECMRGDVQLRLRPGNGKAAGRQKRRFEAGVVGWCNEKEGERLSERD